MSDQSKLTPAQIFEEEMKMLTETTIERRNIVREEISEKLDDVSRETI